MSAAPRVTETDVERLAAAVGLSIASADRLAVAQQLSGLLDVAELVTGFPLPADVEAAPVFRP